VAVTFTFVVPMGNRLPLGGVAVTEGVPQPPLVVTVKTTAAPLELVAATMRLLEQLRIRGGVEACKTPVPKSSRFAATATRKALFVFMAQLVLTMVDVVVTVTRFAQPSLLKITNIISEVLGIVKKRNDKNKKC